ncbi:MAG: cation acetate symporter [Planctomycetota bacterium]
MIPHASLLAIIIFVAFIAAVLGLSTWLGRHAKSSAGYFAAHGQVPWWVNGIAFAGDYLSAASFLGICGAIAIGGYDGFLYSIGFLAGWIVALFVIAEPLKRLGKYTFADALDARFHSRGIRLAAAVSTLVVSIFYLIPQMVGAGTLIQPLLGLPYAAGVGLVGGLVIIIVATAGMVSTTWVQFIKGGLLVVFCTILTIMILVKGIKIDETHGHPAWRHGPPEQIANGRQPLEPTGDWAKQPQFVRFAEAGGGFSTWKKVDTELTECQTLTITADKKKLVDGIPHGDGEGKRDLRPVGDMHALADGAKETGPLNPFAFFDAIAGGTVTTWPKPIVIEADGCKHSVFYPELVSGEKMLAPGAGMFKSLSAPEPKWQDQLGFISLMLALFLGTASLPHILIRYYTVKDARAARSSTVVGIAAIGFFYILTLFLGLGAMVSGVLDPTNQNLAAPLLARSFGEVMFAIISAVAFTTVLGTVSGLIMAASGTIVHDLVGSLAKAGLNDHQEVKLGRWAAVGVGIIAMILGLIFEKFNISFLVAWAFNIAASANLPALVMRLFWAGTTKQGVAWAVFVGLITSLGWVLLTPDAYENLYGYTKGNALTAAPMPFSHPALVTVPLGFFVLVIVSLVTKRRAT